MIRSGLRVAPYSHLGQMAHPVVATRPGIVGGSPLCGNGLTQLSYMG